MDPDVRAAYDIILHHMRSSGFSDTMEDCELLAEKVCQGIRGKIWLQHVKRIEHLEAAIADLAVQGLCPHCGMRLVS